MNTKYNENVIGTLDLIAMGDDKYQICKDASDSEGGIAKLYTQLGDNTDGSVAQNVVTTSLNLKADKSTTYTKTEVDDLQTVQNNNILQKLDQKVDADVFNETIDYIKDKLSYEFEDGNVTSYIINQSGDTSNRLCEDMIEGHVASMNATDKMWIDGKYDFVDVIARIKANSHLYVGKYDSTADKLEVKLVSDEDKTKYADGTDIEWTHTEIDPETNEETTEYYDIDLFMKLPEFWWKCESIATDVYKISFSMNSTFVDNTWNHWEGDTFIGVYKGFIDGNNKCYSRKNVIPTVNKSWTVFTDAATARSSSENVPYRIVTYEAHQIMCLLGFGWLGTTDSQSICGRGSTDYPKITGLCDAKGMVDTVADVDGGNSEGTSTGTSINFWGIENWWGDISEWIDNIHTANSSGLLNVYDYKKHSVVRTIQNGMVSGNQTLKLFLGTNGDVTPTSTVSNANYDKAFADYGGVNDSSGRVASRSNYGVNLNGGVAFLRLLYAVGAADAGIGSRLLYKGEYIIVNSFSE